MNPYQPGQDVFGTSADTRFNSFSDPSALAMNQHNGQWGVNPNLLTPAYTAAYRPSYNGSQGNAFGGPTPGFGRSLNQVFNPFAGGGTNYGGNTYSQLSPYNDALTTGAADHAANFTQKWVVPGVASWLSYKFLSNPLGAGANRFAAGLATGVAGGSFSAAQTATIGRVAGAVGGFAGSMFLPMAAAEVFTHAVDHAVFDPYVAQRQMTNDMRRNFAGVSFSDGSGNSVTGKGFSRVAAGRQAAQISQIAAKDFSFNQSEFANMTDLAARSGLLDTTQGGQVAERMRMIAKQVKTVMAIGNTSDFKEAIETISKLQMSGVAVKDVSSVYSRLGGMASVAGVSVQKMMSTVGAQGEYLFGANGLNPYGGQLAAASAYSAFSVANRNGLISRGAMARMGGLDGMTQSATSGILNMASTPYASISAMNNQLGGGNAGDVVGNLSKFGGFIAQDALNNTGLFNLRRGELASNSLEKDGLAGQMKQLMDIANLTPSSKNKDGSIKGGAAYQILTQNMKLSDSEARAIMMHQIQAQDPNNLKSILAGLDSGYEEQRLKRLEQDGRAGIFNVLTRPIVEMGHDIQSAGSSWVHNSILDPIHSVGDSLDKWSVTSTIGEDTNPAARDAVESLGINEESRALTKEEISMGSKFTLGSPTSLRTSESEHKNVKFSSETEKKIIAAVKKGNAGSSELDMLIAEAVHKKEIDGSYLEKGKMNSLKTDLIKRGVITKEAIIAKNASELTGISDVNEATAALQLSDKVGEEGWTTDNIDAFNKAYHTSYTAADAAEMEIQLTKNNDKVAGRDTPGWATKTMDWLKADVSLTDWSSTKTKYDDKAKAHDNFLESLEAKKAKDLNTKSKGEAMDSAGRKIIDPTNTGLTEKGDTNITSQGIVNIYVQGANLKDGNTKNNFIRAT